MRVNKQSNQQPRHKDEHGGNYDSANAGGDNGQSLGVSHSVKTPFAEVEADDGLCRLGNGVAYHENERTVITGYAEGCNTVVAEIAHENLIAHKHYHRH